MKNYHNSEQREIFFITFEFDKCPFFANSKNYEKNFNQGEKIQTHEAF